MNELDRLLKELQKIHKKAIKVNKKHNLKTICQSVKNGRLEEEKKKLDQVQNSCCAIRGELLRTFDIIIEIRKKEIWEKESQ